VLRVAQREVQRLERRRALFDRRILPLEARVGRSQRADAPDALLGRDLAALVRDERDDLGVVDGRVLLDDVDAAT